MGIVVAMGMLLAAVHVAKRPRVTLNVAFMAGSSKQGKALRASVASNCVTAKYLLNSSNLIQIKQARVELGIYLVTPSST